MSVGFVFWHTEASEVAKKRDNLIYSVRESHVDLFVEFSTPWDGGDGEEGV